MAWFFRHPNVENPYYIGLNWEERGMFAEILCKCFQKKSFSVSPFYLAKELGVTEEKAVYLLERFQPLLKEIEVLTTPKPKKLVYNDSHLALARDMWDYIHSRFPFYPTPDFKKWADSIRMIEDDGFSIGQIEDVAVWAQRDAFWQKNIRSADNLRKHFAKLLEQSGLYKK